MTVYTSDFMIGDTADTLAEMPSPKEMTVSLMDVDASTTTRTADGSMHRDRIVGGDEAKRKLALKFPSMHGADVSMLLKAIRNEFIWVKYPDPYTGEHRIAEFYAGDRSNPIYNFDLRGNGVLWSEISFDLIEK